MSELYVSPAVVGAADSAEPVDAEWAAAAAVAAVLGLALAVVVYICTVCEARSFNACYNAVVDYWTQGC